jgi:hypothetical protein
MNNTNYISNYFLLNGASSFYYFKIKNKMILLIGDRHIKGNNINSLSCKKLIKSNSKLNSITDKYDILDFILKLIIKNNNKNRCLDLFLESPYKTDTLNKYYNINHSNIKSSLYFGNNNNNNNELEPNLSFKKTIYNKKSFKRGNKTNLNLLIVQRYFNNRCLGVKNECYSGFRYHVTDLDQSDYSLLLSHYTYLFRASPELKLLPLEDDIIELYEYMVGIRTEFPISINKLTENILNLILYDIKVQNLELNETLILFIKNRINYVKEIPELITKDGIIILNENEFNMKILDTEINRLRNKLIKTNKRNIIKIRSKIIKQLDNIDTKFFNKTTLIYYFRNKLLEYYSNRDINIKGQSIRHSLMEVYTISRMFRNFENKTYNFICDIDENSLKNILYYAGDEHIINIKSFIINIFKITPIISIDEEVITSKSVGFISKTQYKQCLTIPRYINKSETESYFFNTFMDDITRETNNNINMTPWTRVSHKKYKKY